MDIKVLLIDDHALFRAGLENLLTRCGMEVVVAVSNGDEGIQKAAELEPDIVLLDMRMPKPGGLSVLRQLIEDNHELRVIFLTVSTDDNDLLDALRAGVKGYLLKDIETDELVSAIHQVMAGTIVVAPELSPVLARFVSGEESQDVKANNPFSELTPREHDVVLLIAKGQSNKVIGRNLGISDGTVKLHVKAILRKLNLRSRIEAAVMVTECGIKGVDEN